MKQTMIVAALLATTVMAATEPAKGCKVSMAFFTDKDCAKTKETADADKTAAKTWSDLAAAADGKCAEDTGNAGEFKQMKCDAAGLTSGTYTEKECKTPKKDGDDKPLVASLTWGACTAITKDALYVKMTGSQALMAGAAAALAFVGSQF